MGRSPGSCERSIPPEAIRKGEVTVPLSWWRPPSDFVHHWFSNPQRLHVTSSMHHCQANLLWQARRNIGAAIWAANADLILHRILPLGGSASRERSRQRHVQHQFFRGGDPAAVR